MFKKKPTASEVDGVQYRRAKLWQIISEQMVSVAKPIIT